MLLVHYATFSPIQEFGMASKLCAVVPAKRSITLLAMMTWKKLSYHWPLLPRFNHGKLEITDLPCQITFCNLWNIDKNFFHEIYQEIQEKSNSNNGYGLKFDNKTLSKATSYFLKINSLKHRKICKINLKVHRDKVPTCFVSFLQKQITSKRHNRCCTKSSLFSQFICLVTILSH